MNYWECSAKTSTGEQCNTVAEGVGGALGLTAIGWSVSVSEVGAPEILLCPAHFPETEKCEDDANELPCHLCAAERVANSIQEILKDINDTELYNESLDDIKDRHDFDCTFCGKAVSVGTENGNGVIIHQFPFCEQFRDMTPMDFVNCHGEESEG